MDSTAFKPEFSALGIDNLATVLDEIIKKAQQDSEFAKRMHDILYSFDESSGSRKSLIKIDTSKKPIRGYHGDLASRLPAPNSIKDLFQERGISFSDLHKIYLIKEKLPDSFTGEVHIHPNTIEYVNNALITAIKGDEWDKQTRDLTMALKKFGTFKEEPKTAEPAQPQLHPGRSPKQG